MWSLVEQRSDGATEVLTSTDYRSKYEFLKEIKQQHMHAHVDVDVEGYPTHFRQTETKVYQNNKFKIDTTSEIRVAENAAMGYVVLLWEAEDEVWLKTFSAHGLKKGSVVKITKLTSELNGYHVVKTVAREANSVEGPTLLALVGCRSKLENVPRCSGGIMWMYGVGNEPGECLSQFEIDPSREARIEVAIWPTPLPSVTRLLPSTESSTNRTPYIPGITDEMPTQSMRKRETVSGPTISPCVLEMFSQATRQNSSSNTSVSSSKLNACHNREESAFEGFKTVQNPHDNSEISLPPSFTKSSDVNTKSQSELPEAVPSKNKIVEEFEELCEVQEFAFCGNIVSDSDSSDDTCSDVAESVPFSVEELNLDELECSQALSNSIVLSFSRLLKELLSKIAFVLHPVLLRDLDGSQFADAVYTELCKGIEAALMQKDEAVFLVPQKLFGSLHRAMRSIAVEYQFYGGVLLHLLDSLDVIFREHHFHLVRHRVEALPSNPYEALLNSKRPELSYPLSVVSSKSVVPQKPHLASIVDQPDIASLTDEQLKALFKNAPYLMKNEISNPKFLNKMKDYVGQKSSGPLRKYQERCIEKFLTGGNYVFVAPTGAGKTKIFVECSRKLLEKNRAATIVVACPSVALATQQACVYVVEGFLEEGYWVNTFSSDNQLKPATWRHMTCSHNVMVLTPQLLLNVMDFYKDVRDYSIFHDIDLLIIDECHHVRKEHAYNKIMRAHRNDPICSTQVIGFTASPTRSPDVEEGEENLKQLLNQMQAKCVVLTDSNMEVRKHVPAAAEQTAFCEGREEDDIFAKSIGLVIYNCYNRYIRPLVGKIRGIYHLSDQSFAEMHAGLMSSSFENWAKETIDRVGNKSGITYVQCTDIRSSIELLRSCNNSLDLVNDAGFESALKVLARSIMEIGAQTVLHGSDRTERMFTKILTGIYCSRIIQTISPVLQSYSMSPFQSQYSKFPRFIQLIQFLDQYKDQEDMHGMVFVKTRDGVYHLAKMLRMTPSLKDTFVFELTGHGQGNKKKSQRPVASTAESLRGMSGSKQQEVLEHFCRPGRHILCATSAAEEGINVTNCQFVVRYSVTYTGIQRVQSRGRSRVQNGVFFNIIQKYSKEAKFLHKSQQEEENMMAVLQKSERVEHL